MTGYQTNAENGEATPLWEKRFFPVVSALLVAAFFGAVLATSHVGEDYLPPLQFAGCYVSYGSDPLELDSSGRLRSRNTVVGMFKVVAPVGGKHGPLIEATGVDVVERNGRTVFGQGSGGFYWPVTEGSLVITFAPDRQLRLKKEPAAACR